MPISDFGYSMTAHFLTISFIQTVSKHQKKICESNYQKIEHSIELPLVYVNDPFEFDMKRKVFHEEVQNNEINYKGIPCIFKRKG